MSADTTIFIVNRKAGYVMCGFALHRGIITWRYTAFAVCRRNDLSWSPLIVLNVEVGLNP